MGNKTGYNQISGPKYTKEAILTLCCECEGRKEFRERGLWEMAKREDILDECNVILDSNRKRIQSEITKNKIKSIKKLIPEFRSISDFRKTHSKLWYFAHHHHPELLTNIIRQKYSTQQLICKKILESLLGVTCLYNNRKILSGKELDIYFPSFSIACEYNSFFWHKNRKLIDDEKVKLCENMGILLMVIGEKHLNEFRDVASSIAGIKNQFNIYLPLINLRTGLNITTQDLDDVRISEEDLLYESYSKSDIDYIVHHCDRYSEIKTKYNKIWQYLLRNKLLHLLEPVKKRDYIYMSEDEMLNHIKEKFPTYTKFCQHKINQLVRKRGFLQRVKMLYV